MPESLLQEPRAAGQAQAPEWALVPEQEPGSEMPVPNTPEPAQAQVLRALPEREQVQAPGREPEYQQAPGRKAKAIHPTVHWVHRSQPT